MMIRKQTQPIQRPESRPTSLAVILVPRAKEEVKASVNPCHSSFMGCITRHQVERQFVSISIWASAKTRSVLVNTYVACLDATRTILRLNTKDNESRMAEESKGMLGSALRLTLSLSCQLMIERCAPLAIFLSKAVFV